MTPGACVPTSPCLEYIDTSVLGSIFSADGQTLPRMLTIRFTRNAKVTETSPRKLRWPGSGIASSAAALDGRV